MSILTIEQISAELKTEKNLVEAVKSTGLSWVTVRALESGNRTNYEYNTLKLISDYILQNKSKVKKKKVVKNDLGL